MERTMNEKHLQLTIGKRNVSKGSLFCVVKSGVCSYCSSSSQRCSGGLKSRIHEGHSISSTPVVFIRAQGNCYANLQFEAFTHVTYSIAEASLVVEENINSFPIILSQWTNDRLVTWSFTWLPNTHLVSITDLFQLNGTKLSSLKSITPSYLSFYSRVHSILISALFILSNLPRLFLPIFWSPEPLPV